MEKLHGIGNKTNPITWKQVAPQNGPKPEMNDKRFKSKNKNVN